jgi:hypothetical protein
MVVKNSIQCLLGSDSGHNHSPTDIAQAGRRSRSVHKFEAKSREYRGIIPGPPMLTGVLLLLLLLLLPPPPQMLVHALNGQSLGVAMDTDQVGDAQLVDAWTGWNVTTVLWGVSTRPVPGTAETVGHLVGHSVCQSGMRYTGENNLPRGKDECRRRSSAPSSWWSIVVVLLLLLLLLLVSYTHDDGVKSPGIPLRIPSPPGHQVELGISEPNTGVGEETK